MINRLFSERLNHELDEMGVPQDQEERVAAFARLMNIHRFTAANLLKGETAIEPITIQLVANELEVDVGWLLGSEKGFNIE